MQNKELYISSKRSIKIGSQYFTFECGKLVSLEAGDDIEQVKTEVFNECNFAVDNQCLDVKESWGI